MKSFHARFFGAILFALVACCSCSRHDNKAAIKLAFDAGINQCQSGQYAQAIASFNKVIELDPQNTDAYVQRGVARSHLKDYAGVVADNNRGG